MRIKLYIYKWGWVLMKNWEQIKLTIIEKLKSYLEE
ncbi:hypothetical protein P344_05840 [Spiroplasma mirum ATCC 29335]|uniref:Uncharacterized protein n=1 Tax=Spiroplasma mirum ATCC 29335 TaxID=838561 RepID=W6AP26_9MOLU|nr:hypothetical protein P344_05840 [Spiroplasma mirum ATCC 29335]